MIKDVLSSLHIKPLNAGCSYGSSFWSSTQNDRCISSINPSNEMLIAKVACGSSADYNRILEKSCETFTHWKMTPAPKRGEMIRQIGHLLRQKKEDLGQLVSLEMGKSLQEGLGEVQEMIDMADLAVGQSRMLYGNTMHSERPLHRMYEQWHPLGPVAVISAFNFPVAVWAWNAFIAAIAGNTVVWKPSSKTPLCAVAVQHLCNTIMKHHQLEGIFNLFISDDRALSENLLKDTRIPLVSFTGSSHVGQTVATQVAKRMGRCLLECSGNNAIIVDETADLDLALPSLVFGAVGTAGQRCTSTRRLFLHESIADKMTKAIATAYQKIKVGDPLDSQNHMGPLIDNLAVTQFENAVQQAVDLGGKIRVGGHRLTRKGFFVEPTVIEADPAWPIVQQETFAPILYVMTYKKLNEAITLQNAVSQGLSSALFTRDLKHAEQFLSAMGSDCGIANINIGTSGAEIGGAFGGEKSTGGGREAGSDVWKFYMRRQTNTINWSEALPLAQGIKFNLD